MKIQFIEADGTPKGEPVEIVEVAECASDISPLRAASLVAQGVARYV